MYVFSDSTKKETCFKMFCRKFFKKIKHFVYLCHNSLVFQFRYRFHRKNDISKMFTKGAAMLRSRDRKFRMEATEASTVCTVNGMSSDPYLSTPL